MPSAKPKPKPVPPASGRRAHMYSMLPSLVINAAGPLLVYSRLTDRDMSETTAFAIAAAVPVVYTLLGLLRRGRLDPIGVVATVGYGIALLILVLTGGDELVIKLHEAIITGPLGLIGLLSVAVRRPLIAVVVQVMARRNPALRGVASDPRRRAMFGTMTAVLSTTMVLHALAQFVLAETLSTKEFLAVSHPVGWAILAVGFGVLILCRNRMRARLRQPAQRVHPSAR